MIDPIYGGDQLYSFPDTSIAELAPFYESARNVGKTGLHNPYKNVHRYRLLGDVMTKTACALKDPVLFDYFVYMIMRCAPKSYNQAYFELLVTRNFIENFAGDGVRMLANRGFIQPGDHDGQSSIGMRWPYGYTALITPFNFPLEIPVLQMLGSVFMGNRCLVKPDERTALPLEAFVRLLIHCGLPPSDLDFLYASGAVSGELLQKTTDEGTLRMTLFTGSQAVADKIAEVTKGKCKLEDAGYDWKVLGPDGASYSDTEVEYVAHQCDMDAFAFSGQKCSAQSIMFMHESWAKRGLLDKYVKYSQMRNLQDLTIGPVLTWSNTQIEKHIEKILSKKNSQVITGGSRLTDTHAIPECYGSFKPTIIQVNIDDLVNDKEYCQIVFTELFGPFSIVVEWKDNELDKVLKLLNHMENNLTAALVSNDTEFQRKVLGETINGTQYAGLRARTTGAPQNHWFGPCGSPMAGGIGTPEAIKYVWSSHREIIYDEAKVPDSWTAPSRG